MTYGHCVSIDGDYWHDCAAVDRDVAAWRESASES